VHVAPFIRHLLHLITPPLAFTLHNPFSVVECPSFDTVGLADVGAVVAALQLGVFSAVAALASFRVELRELESKRH
jgi:hypothetical protein